MIRHHGSESPVSYPVRRRGLVAAPTGLEPAISCVTGRRDRPTSLRSYIGTGSWRSNHDFSGQSRAYSRYTKPVYVGLSPLVRRPGLEPGVPKPRVYSPLRYQFRSSSHMVIQEEFESSISGVKGRRLSHFDHWTVFNTLGVHWGCQVNARRALFVCYAVAAAGAA